MTELSHQKVYAQDYELAILGLYFAVRSCSPKPFLASHARQPLSEIYGEEKWKGYIVTVVKN